MAEEATKKTTEKPQEEATQSKQEKKSDRPPVLGEKGYEFPKRILTDKDVIDAEFAKNGPDKTDILEAYFTHNEKMSPSGQGTQSYHVLKLQAQIIKKLQAQIIKK